MLPQLPEEGAGRENEEGNEGGGGVRSAEEGLELEEGGGGGLEAVETVENDRDGRAGQGGGRGWGGRRREGGAACGAVQGSYGFLQRGGHRGRGREGEEAITEGEEAGVVWAVLSPQGPMNGGGKVSLRATDIHVNYPFPHLSCRCLGQTALPRPLLPTHDVVPPDRAAATAGQVRAQAGKDLTLEGRA